MRVLKINGALDPRYKWDFQPDNYEGLNPRY